MPDERRDWMAVKSDGEWRGEYVTTPSSERWIQPENNLDRALLQEDWRLRCVTTGEEEPKSPEVVPPPNNVMLQEVRMFRSSGGWAHATNEKWLVTHYLGGGPKPKKPKPIKILKLKLKRREPHEYKQITAD